MPQEEEPKPAPTTLDIIFSDKKYFTAVIVISILLLMPLAVFLRKRFFPENKNKGKITAPKKEPEPQLPDLKKERELLNSQKYNIDKGSSDDSLRKLKEDLQREKDYQEKLKLDAINDRMRREKY